MSQLASRSGPGLITACVVIGPGTILTASQVGAKYGYSYTWVVPISCVFMATFMSLGARLGIGVGESPASSIAGVFGRWMAVSIGVFTFVVCAAFQFGNNLGAHAAINAFVHFDYAVIVLNLLVAALLLLPRSLYKLVESIMAGFVLVLLISFAASFLLARPSARTMLAEIVPQRSSDLDLSVLGLFGTTFIITSALFQAYLCGHKKWQAADLNTAVKDAWIGAAAMCALSLLIMWCAAAALRSETINDVGSIAMQLQPVFGRSGQAVFCVGLFCASYSSFIVNSMTGGFILSDSLGLGWRPTDLAPRFFTALVLATGCCVSLLVIQADFNPVHAIVLAQAVTVVLAPLAAIVLFVLTCSRAAIVPRASLSNVLVAVTGIMALAAVAFFVACVKIPTLISQ